MRNRTLAITFALLGLALLPAGASAAGYTTTPAGPFKLQRTGIGTKWYQRVDQLQQTYPRVGLGAVLADANRPRSAFTSPDNVLPGSPHPAAGVRGAFGYGWNKGDNDVDYWTPQGITGSVDANGNPGVHAVSWYREGDAGVRVSFVNEARNAYRHALLVRPTGGSKFASVGIHAGGIAWFGKFLYVADTGVGVRVFDTERIMHVPKKRLGATGNYEYLLPQVGYYRSVGAKLTYSFIALDRQNPRNPSLLAGEYRKSPGARIVRWRIDPASGLIARGQAVKAYVSPFKQLQGAIAYKGRILGSSSAGPRGYLYVGKVGKTAKRLPWGRFPEDLYSTGTSIFSLTEQKGERVVFGVRGDRLIR